MQPFTPPPGLHLVSTPIGALRDITLRALDTLAAADRVLAEDTRVTAKLLTAHGVKARLQAYHEHNAEAARPAILEALAAGEVIALVSDAGTPMISDPGYKLVRAAIDEGHAVFPVPGPSALLSALVVAGLPTDRFLFAGFPPQKRGARQSFLSGLATTRATLVFYEGASRLGDSLADMLAAFGDREAAVARELTKLHETVVRGPLSVLASDPELQAPRGEVVIVVGGGADAPTEAGDIDRALLEALARLPLGEAASEVSRALNLPRRDLYKRALALKDQA